MLDYAGLFPPAKLPLGQTVSNYLEYMESEDNWMIGKLVIPIGKLDELEPYHLRFDEFDNPIELSILLRGGNDEKSFYENLEEDLILLEQKISDANFSFPIAEVKIPHSFYETKNANEFVGEVKNIFKDQNVISNLFLENHFVQDWQAALENLVQELSKIHGIGMKIRTGGTEAQQIPSIEDVATFIRKCKDSDILFKATAGLHHPFRNYSEELGTYMHGFLNVIFASIAHVDNIEAILKEESIEAFVFEEERIGWNDAFIDLQQIEKGRKETFHSFGSCSFMEPKEDLVNLGLWENE